MGLLITIEGGDYVGKTSLAVPGLHAVLSDCGFPVITSREPGGSPEGEEIRNQIFKKVESDAPQIELAELFNKARKIHLEQVIKPFIGNHKEKKGIVILDRYLDSTRVYQGLEGRLPMDKIYELENEFVDGFLPDITFILYFPEEHIDEIIKIRKKLSEEEQKTGSSARSHTPWDDASLIQYRKRQEYYHQLQQIAKDRGENRQFIYIDASQNPYEIVKKMCESTIEYILEHKAVEAPMGLRGALSKSLAKTKTALFMLYQVRQWKKQQSMLKSGKI